MILPDVNVLVYAHRETADETRQTKEPKEKGAHQT